MATIKAVILGTCMWALGVGFYTLSYYIPFLDDLELQANLALALAIVPIAWVGAHFFYRWAPEVDGLKLSAIIILTAIFWDSVITVPLLIIPQGGSYGSFFLALGFWCIALEYALVIWSYWKFRIKTKHTQTHQ